MRDAVRKYLIDTAIGVAIAFIACVSPGIFKAESTVDTIRILCDGFFAAAMLLLAAGGLQWTYNGGVMDGLGFSFKMAFSRIRGDFESSHMTFSEYRERREKKSSTPAYLLLAGASHLVIALIFFAIYYGIQ